MVREEMMPNVEMSNREILYLEATLQVVLKEYWFLPLGLKEGENLARVLLDKLEGTNEHNPNP